jgi:dTDP-glucose 4,6-dehydratase
MTDITVIGDTSFTGKRFCEMMQERGYQTYGVSLRSDDWLNQIAELQTKYIVNFAALNVVPPSWEHASDYFHVNVTKVAVLAKFLRRHAFTKYVHISTPEVYGNCSGEVPEYRDHRPTTPYALSRSTAEQLLMMEYDRYGLPVVITRACNVYGPGQQLHRLIPKVFWHIMTGTPFPLEGGGKSKRAFMYVDDMCNAIWRAMVRGRSGEAYNITHGPMHKIVDIVGMCFGTCSDTELNIRDVPGREGQDAVYELSGEKFRLELGDSGPKTQFEDGLAAVRKWMDENWETLKDAPTEYEFRP